MGEAGVSKRVLQAIADAHPDEGSFAVHRVDIHRGWGDLVNVTIHTQRESREHSAHWRRVRAAVERALGSERYRVTLVETG